jgi:predicted nucleotidyltransferase component of viral defense system
LNHAKAKGEAFDLTLTRYALERFLYRLSLTTHKGELILKGAMLFQIWSQTPHRATRDLDLLSQGDVNTDSIASMIREICGVELEDDGLGFDLERFSVREIREEAEHGGVRAKFTARLGSAKIPMQIDFGGGDAVTPAARETKYPTILDMEAPLVLAYPRETVVAEKLEAIVNLGMDNSRMKDYFDLWFIATTYRDDPATQAHAVQRTFNRRHQALPMQTPVGLTDRFATDGQKLVQWNAFRDRAIGGSLSLLEVVTVARAFAVPLFEMAADATDEERESRGRVESLAKTLR